MPESVLVSVLMPVYNAQRYVALAVDSVLGQTFRNFEFHIIDDGSTDGSLEILKRYADQDPRIRLISRPNTGYVIALNEMLAQAKGEFIARMDADDISLPDRFQKQVDALRGSPELGVVGGQLELMDPGGHTLCPRHVPLEHAAIESDHLIGQGGAIAHPAAMIRTQILQNAGGYLVEYWPAEDLDLFLRLGERTRLANLPDLVLRYRLHEHSTSRRHKQVQMDAVYRAVAAARIRRGLPPLAEQRRLSTPSESLSKTYRTWAWCALDGGKVDLARKYAWGAFWRRPFSFPSWKLLYCAAKGTR